MLVTPPLLLDLASASVPEVYAVDGAPAVTAVTRR
jgi:hypothetical protein